MNYLNELKRAIDYIEENLDKDINFEIYVAHISHMIRENANQEAGFSYHTSDLSNFQ